MKGCISFAAQPAGAADAPQRQVGGFKFQVGRRAAGPYTLGTTAIWLRGDENVR